MKITRINKEKIINNVILSHSSLGKYAVCLPILEWRGKAEQHAEAVLKNFTVTYQGGPKYTEVEHGAECDVCHEDFTKQCRQGKEWSHQIVGLGAQMALSRRRYSGQTWVTDMVSAVGDGRGTTWECKRVFHKGNNLCVCQATEAGDPRTCPLHENQPRVQGWFWAEA